MLLTNDLDLLSEMNNEFEVSRLMEGLSELEGSGDGSNLPKIHLKPDQMYSILESSHPTSRNHCPHFGLISASLFSKERKNRTKS